MGSFFSIGLGLGSSCLSLSWFLGFFILAICCRLVGLSVWLRCHLILSCSRLLCLFLCCIGFLLFNLTINVLLAWGCLFLFIVVDVIGWCLHSWFLFFHGFLLVHWLVHAIVHIVTLEVAIHILVLIMMLLLFFSWDLVAIHIHLTF